MKRPRSASETFSTKFQLSEVNEESGVIRGVAMVFGYPVDVYPPTIIERGAFTKTLAEQGDRVRFCWMHDMHDPIGKPELRETETGLEFAVRFDPVPNGIRAETQIRTGTLTDVSIGFDPIKWEMVD